LQQKGDEPKIPLLEGLYPGVRIDEDHLPHDRPPRGVEGPGRTLRVSRKRAAQRQRREHGRPRNDALSKEQPY
jgi:hypothetical protein